MTSQHKLILADSPDWLFPTMILMALGGNQIRMAIMQFCDLFPDHRSTALTIMSGTYAASAALFLVFQVWNTGRQIDSSAYFITF